MNIQPIFITVINLGNSIPVTLFKQQSQFLIRIRMISSQRSASASQNEVFVNS
jgi:hypothetical protein